MVNGSFFLSSDKLYGEEKGSEKGFWRWRKDSNDEMLTFISRHPVTSERKETGF
jgi:hypothetical protein